MKLHKATMSHENETVKSMLLSRSVIDFFPKSHLLFTIFKKIDDDWEEDRDNNKKIPLYSLGFIQLLRKPQLLFKNKFIYHPWWKSLGVKNTKTQKPNPTKPKPTEVPPKNSNAGRNELANVT